MTYCFTYKVPTFLLTLSLLHNIPLFGIKPIYGTTKQTEEKPAQPFAIKNITTGTYLANTALKGILVSTSPNEILTDHYKISFVNHDNSHFAPLLQDTIFLNNYVYALPADDTKDKKQNEEIKRTPTQAEKPEEKVENPLLKKTIKSLGLITTEVDTSTGDILQNRAGRQSLTIATAEDPSTLYLMENIHAPDRIITIPEIKDMNGKKAGRIVSLSSSNGDLVVALAVVTDENDQFGTSGSGLALINLARSAHDGLLKYLNLSQVTQKNTNPDSADLFGTPLQLSTNAIKILEDVAEISPNVSIHWDAKLRRIYLGLQIRTGTDSTAGGRALLMGTLTTSGQLDLYPIAPDDAFVSNNHIVGARGSNESVSIHHVETLWTTTSVPYLLVLGGNGTPEETRNCVSALPLVNQYEFDKKGNRLYSAQNGHGMLAARSARAQSFFNQGSPSYFQYREITQPAQHADDLYTNENTADNYPIAVGGGALAAGPITQLLCKDNAVFAVVQEPTEGYVSGIYHSQALLDQHGQIKDWTQWQCALQTDTPIHAASYNPITGTFIIMQQDDTHTTTFKRTEWIIDEEIDNPTDDKQADLPKIEATNGSITRLKKHIEPFFIEDETDIIGLLETDYPAAPSSPEILIALGKKSLALIPSDALTPEIEEPCRSHNDGTLTAHPDKQAQYLSGGALETIGTITTVDTGPSASDGALFIGGTNGLLVLSDHDDDRWPAPENGMSFKPVGDFKNIKKVLYDQGFLYVLTETSLYCMPITNTAAVDEIITTQHFTAGYASFFDFIISNGHVLLATSKGLLHANYNDRAWKSITIPGSIQAVHKLFSISKTGLQRDIAQYAGGLIYAISNDCITNKTNITCLSVNRTENGIEYDVMTDNIRNNKRFPFASFATPKNTFTSNGAGYMHVTNYATAQKKTLLHSGITRATNRTITIDQKQYHTISSLLYSNVLGTVVIAGSCGFGGIE